MDSVCQPNPPAAWLGVTTGHGTVPKGSDGAAAAAAMQSVAFSGRITRIVLERVPVACAAAMPSRLLHKLASSPQVLVV
jgi:hypothetical protein